MTPISVTTNVSGIVISNHREALPTKKDAGRRVVKGVPPAPADGVI
jgi:hypothetical protein